MLHRSWAGVQETRETADGFAFRLADDPPLFAAAAEWIPLERRCCPFMSFALRWDANDRAPWLALSGAACLLERATTEKGDLDVLWEQAQEDATPQFGDTDPRLSGRPDRDNEASTSR